jgi:hypothetical protein
MQPVPNVWRAKFAIITCKIDSTYDDDENLIMPFVTCEFVNFDFQFECGICRQKGMLKFPGSLCFNLIDPSCSLACKFCHQEFSITQLGLHMVTCTHQSEACPACDQAIPICDIPTHFQTSCAKVSLLLSRNVRKGARTSEGSHFELKINQRAEKLGGTYFVSR